MGLVLSDKEKKLVLIAKKKGFKGLSEEEKAAVLKYKKIMAANKKGSSEPTKAKATKDTKDTIKTKKSSSQEQFTAEDKRLLLSAKKKGMKNLTPEEKRAVLKYKKMLKEQQATAKSAKEQTPKSEPQKATKPTPKKLPVIKEQIPDIPNVKPEHFAKFKGKKIMIVEDNLINQKMLEAILKNSGIDIVIANNGKIAVQNLSKGMKFDLVLMDIEMPELDGLSATKMIRKSKHFANLPIIALTSSTKKEDIIKILKSGMNGYIFKPIALGRLYNTFRLFMGGKK